jgi:chromosome partition protein MukB
MSRARATALILVNWKGVFFERYLLDRHVTALEGANGAGKTTVMIAAYVVLLPDLTRLKFTNLGETGATAGDRGIWGRLGEQGPSYAALEVELGDGELVLIGVHLERKAAPTLALTPFLLSNLPPHTSTHGFLLQSEGNHDQVPSLAEFQSSAKDAGASLEVFSSSKDYFASLFERGINPLRLSTDEERNKFNDMLRTSMTGGISRTLTSDLRSFLLKQQTGLFDTLSRMRRNLEACRRTRLEVSEARVLEHEINGVYGAGHAMFHTALAASREQARESSVCLEEAVQKHAHELGHFQELETQLSEATLRKQSLTPRVERARETEGAARERQLHVERALAASGRLALIESERAAAWPAAELAREHKANAALVREKAKAERDRAQQTLVRAAAGLASLQAGLEELHRQAHAFRQVREKLRMGRTSLGLFLESDSQGGPFSLSGLLEPEARRQLEALGSLLDELDCPTEPKLSSGVWTERLAEGLARLQQARAELDRARAERQRRAEAAAQLQAEQSEARAALSSIAGAPIESDWAARAREELGRLNELELLGARVSELSLEWQRLTERAERQRELRAEVLALGFDPLPSAAQFVVALAAAESSWREAEQSQREHEASAQKHAEQAAALRAKKQTLEAREQVYRRLASVALRLADHGQAARSSRAELTLQLRSCDEARQILRERAAQLEGERQAMLAAAQACEAAGGSPHADLVRIAERVDGQLLAARYEDLDVDAARRAEAELGPLAQAIVVEDPGAALPLLLAESHEQRDVWLLRAGADLPMAGRDVGSSADAASTPDANAADAGSIVIELGYGLRITRLPSQVSLGRAARERRATSLRADAEQASHDIAELERRQRAEESIRRDLELLQEHWEVWAASDPSDELTQTQTELESSLAARAEAQALTRELRVEVARLAAQLPALRAQVGDHLLLDPPDYAAQARHARELLDRARGAAAELARVQKPRRQLLTLVHSLDVRLPDAAELEAWRRAEPELDAARDRLFAVAEALRVVDTERAAFAWADAERAVEERTELVPDLETQHGRALLSLEQAQAAFEASETAWESATAQTQAATAELSAIEAHLTRARAELASEGVEEPSVDALGQAQRDVERHGSALEQLLLEARGSEAEVALRQERRNEAEKRWRSSTLALESERTRAEPAERQWRELSLAAERAGVLEMEELGHDSLALPMSAQRWIEADGKRQLLGDRLEAARGGAELALTISAIFDAPRLESSAPESKAGSSRGERYLQIWLCVREWLMRRLPTPVAELGEPLLALSRLRADLSQLEGHLERQESDLRGTSGDVARSIDVQLRRAVAQIRRLNQSLEGVSFGSIHGIRVQMERVEKMDQVLRALREGVTQELLFQSNLPIEEALDEIFRRHAGGRTGGQRLVDYREYLDLHVQIQRRAEQGWERVNPSQVSTGEAIGIGAALMMVILAEWERDDHLLRRERGSGSLRFLFLDEANRLSQDNLGVLFDLCQTLDLQLLIAAPEVARAEGNTTYRLVRRVNEDGREEVLVTGRRATLPGESQIISRALEGTPALEEQAPVAQAEQLGLALP